MDFWRAVLGLLKRPLVALPVLLLAAAAAYSTFNAVPTTYVSTASMVLTGPPLGATVNPDPKLRGFQTNPLLQFNDSLQTTASILILGANTPESLATLGVTKDGSTKFTINDGHTNPNLLAVSLNGPFIYIKVESPDPDVARKTAEDGGTLVRELLRKRQVELKAPAETYITITQVAQPTPAEPQRTRKYAVAGGAAAGVVFVGFLFAHITLRRRAARAEAAQIEAAALAAAAAERAEKREANARAIRAATSEHSHAVRSASTIEFPAITKADLADAELADKAADQDATADK